MTRFDVVVIGGGLVGCASAYYLAKAGAAVLLVDQADINREASGRNAGTLHFQLEYRLIKYGDSLASQFAQIIPLSLVAIEDWEGLEDELGADLEVTMAGGLIVGETASDIQVLEKRQALQEQWGLHTTLLSRKDVRRIAPYLTDTVLAAGYCAKEGHANPRLVTLAFARKAAIAGAGICSHSRVLALERVGSEWQLVFAGKNTTPSEVRTGAVLNAAGAWAGELAAMAHLHLPIYPVPLLMNVTERAAPLIPHVLQHTSRRLTIKQVSAGNILVGGGWPGRFSRSASMMMNVHRRPDIVVENLIENLMLARRLVPAVHQLHLLRSWTGTTGVTADQMPLLGPVTEAPGFFVAAGGAAFTHGPTYARLISELIVKGRASQSIELYSPARFSHVNNFMASV